MSAPRTIVAGIVVTYHPDTAFPQRLAAIARETNPVIVVDNSAEPSVRYFLRATCAAHACRLIENSENRGLGAALNQGLAALDPAIAWVIAFDQDSTPEPGFTENLLRVAGLFRERPPIVGANWHDEARPEAPSRHLRRRRFPPLGFHRTEATTDLRDVTCVITSGTLFSAARCRELGGFDEALFLDLVDTDFCLRARQAGIDVAVASAARLAHRRGAKRPVRLMGRTYWPAFMPPLRLHYLFRNRLLLFRRHAWRFPHWAMFELVYATKICAEILFLEDNKRVKFAACLRGLRDGILGRTGKLP